MILLAFSIIIKNNSCIYFNYSPCIQRVKVVKQLDFAYLKIKKF